MTVEFYARSPFVVALTATFLLIGAYLPAIATVAVAAYVVAKRK